MCEPKRRRLNKDDPGVRIGFLAYIKFYEMAQGSAKLKTFDDFADSPYYKAFVKFGRYCVDIRAVNPEQFVRWVLKQNKKIDHWCKDKVYTEYLYTLLRQESSTDALERSIITMQEWSEEVNPPAEFNDYFKAVSTNRLVQHILNGRISPWVIYCCDSGIGCLEALSEEQLTMIMPWIDPDFWQRKFADYVADTEWVKMILKEAGL
mgnify:CR=1 FL=1